MKHLITLLILGGAILLSPTHSKAESYTLSYSLVHPDQKGKPVGRSSHRPLVVDLVGYTLTLPSQVEGYTLTLESEEGEVYTYYITGMTLEIPQELKGTYKVIITNGNSHYSGELEL